MTDTTIAIKKLLHDTTGYSLSNGWSNVGLYGYHSFDFPSLDIHIAGVRNCRQRLEKWKLSLEGMKVVDLACNTGGLLLHMEGIIQGLGLDVDKHCIDAGNAIATLINKPHIQFKQSDLQDIYKYSLNFEPDLCLVCNVWNPHTFFVLDWALDKSKWVIFESGQSTDLEYIKKNYVIDKVLSTYSDDDNNGNYSRQTYLLRGRRFVEGDVI